MIYKTSLISVPNRLKIFLISTIEVEIILDQNSEIEEIKIYEDGDIVTNFFKIYSNDLKRLFEENL